MKILFAGKLGPIISLKVNRNRIFIVNISISIPNTKVIRSLTQPMLIHIYKFCILLTKALHPIIFLVQSKVRICTVDHSIRVSNLIPSIIDTHFYGHPVSVVNLAATFAEASFFGARSMIEVLYVFPFVVVGGVVDATWFLWQYEYCIPLLSLFSVLEYDVEISMSSA